LFAFYIQDSEIDAGLTVDFGVRADRTRMLMDASQWSPGSVRPIIPCTSTAAWLDRSTFSRCRRKPAPWLVGEGRELSPFVDESVGGGKELEPERQWAMKSA
jgi:hypothetical protein